MAKQEPVETIRLHSPVALVIQEELERVRQRSNARLGTGINPRAVQRMVAKLDKEKDQ